LISLGSVRKALGGFINIIGLVGTVLTKEKKQQHQINSIESNIVTLPNSLACSLEN
jgi:hypothetical protein